MLFPALADPAGDHTALSFPDRSLSYAELAVAARAVAAGLDGTGRVAVVAEPRIETAVAVIGALLAGVPVIPINPKSGASELAHIVSDAEPDAIAVAPGSAVPEAFGGRRRVQIDLDGDLPCDGGTLPDLGDENPALIVYTSGTTGRPKGAMLPRRAIASNLDALAEVWAWTDADVVAHGLPLFHVHGLVIGILGPVRRGGTALHLGRFSPEAVQEALEGPGTMLFGVPTMYRRLADAAAESPALADALGGARLLVSGSAALPASEHARLQELTGRGVVERYGMTETLMNTAIHADATPAPGTVGPPLPGVEVRLVDDDGALLEGADDETIGEIQVRGPNLFLEYLNRPDATAEAMRDGWFATGDMATRTSEGYIRIVGRRATDLIKSGGYKIGAGEIEGCLREHPAVEDAAVTGEPDDDLGERVVAWIVLRDGASVPESELVDHVADQLAPHKRPRDVRFLAELPRNDMGKVQKARLGAE
ncbi:MAG TPA: acyl-CoA synthetase [Solirubrobacteraceae bacterium]|jgi:malonyl-CoA/methylmalonyl-CoA synthetase|nr:acyl-CoA synthetase [Solirubrobacteraceae bacterium]